MRRLTLSEAAAETGLSRQGVHKILMRNEGIPREVISLQTRSLILIPEKSIPLIKADIRVAGRPEGSKNKKKKVKKKRR